MKSSSGSFKERRVVVLLSLMNRKHHGGEKALIFCIKVLRRGFKINKARGCPL